MWYSFGACSAMFARAACQSPAHDEAMFLSSDAAFQSWFSAFQPLGCLSIVPLLQPFSPWLLVYCPFVAAFQLLG